MMMTMGLGVVGLALHLRRRRPPRRRHPARPADRGPGGRAGPGRLAVQDHRRPRRGLEGGPRRRSSSAAARRPAAPTTSSRCSWPSAVGIDPDDVRYMSYDGGGPLTSALLGYKIEVGFSGLGEFEGQIEAGELRVLAVSGEERLDGRGGQRRADAQRVRHRPGLHQLARRARPARHLRRAPRRADRAAARRCTTPPSGRSALEENGWIDAFATGDEFEAFLDEQDDARRRHPEGAGTAMSTTTRHHPRGARTGSGRPGPRPGAVRPGGAARGRSAATRSTTPPRWTSASPTRSARASSPTSSAPVLLLLGVLLAVATLRGDLPEAEGGEDVDLTPAGRLGHGRQAGRRLRASPSPPSTCSAGRSPARCSSPAPPGSWAAARWSATCSSASSSRSAPGTPSTSASASRSRAGILDGVL